MIHGAPGLDAAALVRGVLAEEPRPARSRQALRLSAWVGDGKELLAVIPNAYDRMFRSSLGKRAVGNIGNESRTLDALSFLSVELLLEYMQDYWKLPKEPPGFGRRFLTVRGQPQDPPTLLVLDPAVTDVSQSRRVTDEVDLHPAELMAAFERLRPHIDRVDDKLADAFGGSEASVALQLMAIAQPEIVLSRRPRMVPLCAPSPWIGVHTGTELSSVGVFCRDRAGRLGVTACFHGTGPVGTPVTVGGVPAAVDLADDVQDLVFIALPAGYALPNLCARGGVRNVRAPSEAEDVSFEGAGTGRRIDTHVMSHDAGILRKRPAVQLKVQTPPDTNSGDSGAALVDADDRVVGFGFERTGIGEYPEFTDWIWADNALSALGLAVV